MPLPSPASSFDSSSAAQSERAKRGRKQGTRAKLGQRFFQDLYAAWEEQGESVIARAAFHDPMGFASMVARLMPQKIEVSTPTDGMTDERLSDLIDLAERMAALKAGAIEHVATVPLALGSNHEKVEVLDAVKEGGGGPFRVEPHGGKNTSYTLRADPADPSETAHNKVCHSINATPVPTPYPVGRPFPESPSTVERRNIAKLEDIDPESLF